MDKYKMCANEDMAISILDFIKRNYEKHLDQAGVQKYIEALQMGIDALNEHSRQKEEIKTLQSLVDEMSDYFPACIDCEEKNSLGERTDECLWGIDNTNYCVKRGIKNIANIMNENKALKAEIERWRNALMGECMLSTCHREEELKSEAYKEIISKLKEHLCSYDLPNYHSFRAIDEDVIDEVLKEMVGDNNG